MVNNKNNIRYVMEKLRMKIAGNINEITGKAT
jgi:hypothetical protein